MNQFLILPMGGTGQRFIKAGYKTYKPFLKVSKKYRIVDNIINNFANSKTRVIILGNEQKFQFIRSQLNKNIIFIKIKNHRFGPLHSIFLASTKLKSIIKNNPFFIVYSDINWNWEFEKVKKFIKKKDAVVFTHKGFHPDLEIDTKSDFCLLDKKGYIKKTSAKKLISKDYKKSFLAAGCYYFKNYEYLGEYFRRNKNFLKNKKKEYYLIQFINFLIKNKLKINHYNLSNFVHLGIPSQYENFLHWRKVIVNDFNKSLALNSPNVMLMAGKGERVKKLKQKKPFLEIKNYKIYDYIFKKFGTKNNYILTNKNYKKGIKKKYKTININNSTSMLETIQKSLKYLDNKKNFFISSCDCFGIFDKSKFFELIKKRNPDVILFVFKVSNFQKKLTNSHTIMNIKKNNITSIDVKKSNFQSKLGHAGFFWIKDSKVLKLVQKFKTNFKFKREPLLDDYFKHLFQRKEFKVNCFKVDNYVHIGSLSEYKEIKYWENYFKNAN